MYKIQNEELNNDHYEGEGHINFVSIWIIFFPVSNLQSSHLVQLLLFGTPFPLLKSKNPEDKNDCLWFSKNNVMGLLEERKGWISYDWGRVLPKGF